MTGRAVKCFWSLEQCKRAPVLVGDLCFMSVCICPEVDLCVQSVSWCGSSSLPVCVPAVDPLCWAEVMDDAWKLGSYRVWVLSEKLLHSHEWRTLLSLYSCVCVEVLGVNEWQVTDGCCVPGVILALLITRWQVCEGTLFNTVAESGETHTHALLP